LPLPVPGYARICTSQICGSLLVT